MISQSIIPLILFMLIIATTVHSSPCEPPKQSIMNKYSTSKYLFEIANANLSSDAQGQKRKVISYRDIDKSTDIRMKRQPISGVWMRKEFEGRNDTIKMHAFIVRDEDIPPCCTIGNSISDTRHFMCSGAILTHRHAITSASCMHFADVYEHHINAELAVVIDAFSSMPYIIKINRFEMHPNYDYNVESNDLSTYDLAILFLNCSFSLTNIMVPRLPRGFYDDIGHMCCGKNCELMTIIQNADNHHAARILSAKYLPSPIHDPIHQMAIASNNDPAKYRQNDVKPRMYKKHQNISSLSSVMHRVKKSTGKFAGTPSFFLKAPQLTASQSKLSNITKSWGDSEQTRIKNIFDEIANARKKNRNNNSGKRENFSITENRSGREHNLQKSSTRLSKLDEEALTLIDWKNIEEKLGSRISKMNREKMEKFTEKLVDVTMRRDDSVVNSDVTATKIKIDNSRNYQDKLHEPPISSLFNKLLAHVSSDHKNHSLTDFAIAFANIIKNVAVSPNNESEFMVSSDLIVDKNNLRPPPRKYVECPPLGTPIFKKGVLVAMISYTCDDVQNWVEWKYVSISKNINWIRKRIAAVQNQLPTHCDETLQTHPYVNDNYVRKEVSPSDDN